MSLLPILAQASNDNAAATATAAAVALVAGLVGLVIAVAIYIVCALVQSKAIKSLPESARKCNPVFPWLIIIPLAGIVFQILCFLQIPASFLGHFGQDDAESKSAKTMGIVCTVTQCTVLIWWIPCIGGIVALAHLVCLIIFLVKISALGKRALAAA